MRAGGTACRDTGASPLVNHEFAEEGKSSSSQKEKKRSYKIITCFSLTCCSYPVRHIIAILQGLRATQILHRPPANPSCQCSAFLLGTTKGLSTSRFLVDIRYPRVSILPKQQHLLLWMRVQSSPSNKKPAWEGGGCVGPNFPGDHKVVAPGGNDGGHMFLRTSCSLG